MVFGSWGRSMQLAAAVLVALGCASAEAPQAPSTGKDARFAPIVCAEDQVREFYCDGLLPMSTALGAPEPYGNCPAGIESPPGVHTSRHRIARFDAAYTAWARQRAKPGHACCYSWCSEVDVREADEVAPEAGCDHAGVIRETYCMPQLESGTSAPAESPLDQCPVAIRPPEVLHFSVPKAAPLDLVATEARRGRGFPECCYGWCSRMPVGLLPENKPSAAPGAEQ